MNHHIAINQTKVESVQCELISFSVVSAWQANVEGLTDLPVDDGLFSYW